MDGKRGVPEGGHRTMIQSGRFQKDSLCKRTFKNVGGNQKDRDQRIRSCLD